MKIDIAEKEETAKVDGYAITENLTLRATNSTAASQPSPNHLRLKAQRVEGLDASAYIGEGNWGFIAKRKAIAVISNTSAAQNY